MQVKLMPPYYGDDIIKAYSTLSDGNSTMLIIQHMFGVSVTVEVKEEATYVVCKYGSWRQSFQINGASSLDVFICWSRPLALGETRVLFCNMAAYRPV